MKTDIFSLIHWKRICRAGMAFGLAGTSLIAAETYDVLIRGGRLLDGTGTPWRYADVGITGDRLVAVGPIAANATAKLVVDARGKYVTPGFIDAHSHAARGLDNAEVAAAGAQLFQGVTAVVINIDGGGPADLAPQFDQIRQCKPGVNVVPTIGNNAVRMAVMGNVDRAPTPAELKQMEDLVRQAMKLGAFGFTSGIWQNPGLFTKVDEMIALARVAAEFPGAFYNCHIRDEGDYNIGLVASVDEVIEVARAAGLPGIVTHIKAYGPAVRGKSAEVIQHINAARAAGIQVWADQYPYNFAGGSMVSGTMPRWVQEGGEKARMARMADPKIINQIRPEMIANLSRAGGPENIVVRSYEPDRSIEGLRLSEIARARQQEPIDTVIDLLKKGGVGMIAFNMQEADVEAFMKQPWTMTCSDGDLPKFGEGQAHPRSYGTFPRKLQRYAIDQGVITLEHAVHTSSGLPAAVMGIKNRGLLLPGAYADVLVFDTKTLQETATWQKPHAYATGMDYVFVNGDAAIAGGRLVDQRFGRVLLRDKQDY